MKDPSLYVPIHTGLWDHPKTRRLMRRLHLSDVEAVGHLTALWTWAVHYAPDGDLTDLSDEEIAVAGRWHGEAELFAAALRGVGWLDGGVINDWAHYAGEGLAHRAKWREDKRRQRAKDVSTGGSSSVSTECPPDVHRMSAPPKVDSLSISTVNGNGNGNGNLLGTTSVPTEGLKTSRPKKPKASHDTLEAVLEDIHAPTGRTHLERWREKYPAVARSGRLLDRLAEAWDHDARRKRTDMVRYLDGWLYRDEERERDKGRGRGGAGGDLDVDAIAYRKRPEQREGVP